MEYGVVKIIGGEYKGRFGLYDDNEDDKAIVYLGTMFSGAPYVLIDEKFITDQFDIEDVEKRVLEISKDLHSKISDRKRVELLEELDLLKTYFQINFI